MTGLIVALDVGTVAEARGLAAELVDVVDGFKVGLELLSRAGVAAIEEVATLGRPVFADAKLHDIPNTVFRAGSVIAEAGARWVTAHAAGGEVMLRAAVEAMGEGGVLAVTVLTSIPGATSDQVVGMARMAANAGVEGVVCSVWEATAVKDLGMAIFTPGIRLPGADQDDQERVATPEQAAVAGADYVVVGRPVTSVSDPHAAAVEIAARMAGVRG